MQGLTFKTVYAMYLNDMTIFNDEVLPYSESSVRRCWDGVMVAENVSLCDKAVVGKCSACIQLRERLLKVSKPRVVIFDIP